MNEVSSDEVDAFLGGSSGQEADVSDDEINSFIGGDTSGGPATPETDKASREVDEIAPPPPPSATPTGPWWSHIFGPGGQAREQMRPVVNPAGRVSPEAVQALGGAVGIPAQIPATLKQTWAAGVSPEATEALQSVGELPVIKQAGQVANVPLYPEWATAPYWVGKEFELASKAFEPGSIGEKALTGYAAFLRGSSKAIHGMTTPLNVGLAVTPGLQEGLGAKLLAGYFLGQAVKGTPEQWARLKAAPTTNEKIEIATEMGLSYLPAAAFVPWRLPPEVKAQSERMKRSAKPPPVPPEMAAEAAPPGPTRDDVLAAANSRLEELKAKETLEPVEQAEHDFLTENADNPDAIAERFGLTISEPVEAKAPTPIEAAITPEGGEEGAVEQGYAQVEARPTPQRVETRPAGEEPPAGRGDYVEREAEGEEAGRELPPAPKEEITPPEEEITPEVTVRELEEKIRRERDPEKLAALRAQLAEARGEAPPPEEAAPAAAKPRQIRVATDDFGASEKSPVASYVMESGGILSKTAAKKTGQFEANKEQWDDLPTLRHPTHNKIYRPSGEMPDVMASNLYDEGLIKEPSTNAMYRALEQESSTTRRAIKEKRTVEGAAAKPMKQAQAFGKAQVKEQAKGSTGHPIVDLEIGDKVKVGKQTMKVTEFDPDSLTYTFEDGTKFGVQKMGAGEIIFGELEPKPAPKPEAKPPTEAPKEAPPPEKAPPPPEEKPAAPEKVPAKPAAGELIPPEEMPFTLRGEEPPTGEPTAEGAARAKAEAAAREKKEQPDLFAEAQRLRMQAGKEGGFVNAEIMRDAIDFGRRIYRRGMSYAQWATGMLRSLGEHIRDHLMPIWRSITGANILPHARARMRELGAVGATGAPKTQEVTYVTMLQGKPQEVTVRVPVEKIDKVTKDIEKRGGRIVSAPKTPAKPVAAPPSLKHPGAPPFPAEEGPTQPAMSPPKPAPPPAGFRLPEWKTEPSAVGGASPTGPGSAHGIAKVYVQDAIDKGILPPEALEIGVGKTPEEMQNEGFAYIRAGHNPRDIIADMKRDGLLSGPRMAALWAERQRLGVEREVAQRSGTAAQARAAEAAEIAFLREVRPLAGGITNRIMVAWQEAKPGTLATFDGLYRRALELNEMRPLNDAQIDALKVLGDKGEAIRTKNDTVVKKMGDQIEKTLPRRKTPTKEELQMEIDNLKRRLTPCD